MGTIQTVYGDIADGELGPTLAHEHLFFDFFRISNNPDNTMQTWELMAKELARFRAAGGRAILEMPPHGCGDSPSALKQISEAAGVHIVQGTAFYLEETYPEWVKQGNVDEIADFFVDKIETGQDGIRAGII